MTEDEKAIRDLIERQFGSLNWRPGTTGDWNAFTSDFLPGAPLYAAARPVKAQSAQDFVARTKVLAGTKLRSLAEGARTRCATPRRLRRRRSFWQHNLSSGHWPDKYYMAAPKKRKAAATGS